MNCIKSLSIAAVFACSLIAADKPAAPSAAEKPTLDLTGSVQVQAQRAFWDNKVKDNLDELWGRFNFGAKCKASDFSSELNIRAFPEGFGYAPLTGFAWKDSTDTISAKVSTTPIAKFQVEQAWVKYSWKYIDLKTGRFYTTSSKTLQFGNYLDQDAGGAFMGKLAYHNAFEASNKIFILSSSVLLGVSDVKLNTGYLRIYEEIAPIKDLNFGVGYRANVFDLAYNKDAKIDSRVSIVADYTIIKDLKPFIEVGILAKAKMPNKTDAVDTTQTPITFGTTIPTGGILNNLTAEFEIMKDRPGKKDDLQWDVYLDKKLGTRARFQVGLGSDNTGIKTGDVRLGVRFTSQLK